MPRFYFHLCREGGRLDDEQGVALPDAEAAFYQAVRSARELLRADLELGCGWEDQTIVIADEGGAAVEQLPLTEVARYAL